ncbi:MAG TPA: hypothetical protein VGM06_14045 [Polyangiaceae bacterium]|jgi:hypothetical protein
MKKHFLIALPLVVGCSSSSTPPSSTTASDGGGSDAPASPEASADNDASDGGDAAAGSDFNATASDFDCFNDSEWTQIGLSHYKNALGDTAATLGIARSQDGGTYPVGTVVQLNPVEAMVKRAPGFNALSNDWEFFTLNIDAGVVTITARGGGSTVSNNAGTCLGCHLPAQAPWDLICGDAPDGGPKTAHGCTPLPVPYSTLAAISDPLCMPVDGGGAVDAARGSDAADAP